MSNVNTLIKLANSLAKFVEDNEKISLPLFTTKLARAQKEFPEDYTIGMMSTVVGRMANSDKLFISKAEIKDLYEKFHSRNNKFANVFSEELGVKEVELEQKPVHQEYNSNMMNEALDGIIDPVLANSLNQAFGSREKVAEYSKSLAEKAVFACVNKFTSIGLNVRAEVVNGKQGILICSVACDTPRGVTSVIVPVETINDQALLPSTFVGNHGVEEINKDNVVAYVTSRAGEKLTVRADEVLAASLTAKGFDSEISDVDLALIKLNSQGKSEELIAPQILGVKIEEVNPNLMVNLPKIENPEFEAVAKTFDSELGYANFKFGAKCLKQGSLFIENRLKSCGISNYNIAVSAGTNDELMYSVAINGGTVAFKVPVKVEAGSVLPPSVLICSGSVKSFDDESISSLIREEGFDRGAALSASALYGVKPSELVSIVRKAMNDGNYTQAEDALNILAESEDTKAYSIALSAFNHGLNKKAENVNPENVVKCSMIIKSNNSQHALCGHTGLPLHKVCQDKHGHCRPAYRQAMDESYEGVSFMTNKVLF